jgi:hypothetical protein
MGIPVMVLGASGAGKSASMRNLDPEIYSLVEVNGKPLPFRSAKKYISTDNAGKIMHLLQQAARNLIVIDDSQYIMANEFMRRAGDRGFQKFTDIGVSFWQLVNKIQTLPADKIVYFMHHIESDGSGGYKAKTIGKMIDDKIALEGMFSIVLRAEKANGRYFFTTQSDGTDPVKSPIGMFAEEQIDNDLQIVDAAIRSYYSLEPAVPLNSLKPEAGTGKQSTPAGGQNSQFQEQNTAFQEQNGSFSEQGQAAGATEQAPTDTGQTEQGIPAELVAILSRMHNGQQVFTAKEQAFYYDMLDKAGSGWVLQRAEIAAENIIAEMDSDRGNGQNTLFQEE